MDLHDRYKRKLLYFQEGHPLLIDLIYFQAVGLKQQYLNKRAGYLSLQFLYQVNREEWERPMIRQLGVADRRAPKLAIHELPRS